MQEIKSILIEIQLDRHIQQTDLQLRRVLVETIENRNIGEVVEVTTSPEGMEVIFECAKFDPKNNEVADLLISLGFVNFKFKKLDL